MIEVIQTLVPKSRTGRGSLWCATAAHDGQTYEVRSRSGAPQALARALVEAGAPDQPVEVVTDGIKGKTSYRSLHAMAGISFEESAARPLHQIKFRPRPDNIDAE